MVAIGARVALDQLRTQATSPLSLLAALAMPAVFAFVLHSHAPGRADAGAAVGIAGIGMLNAVIVDLLVALSSEKQWRTLNPALGSPGGLAPLVVGRLVGIAGQALISLPGTLLVLWLMWGISADFDWARWIVGGLGLALATTAVVGLMAYFLLRFPTSPGMTNGLAGILIALGALLVPGSALPTFMRWLAWALPQSHVMAWVRGAHVTELGLAAVLCGVFLAAILVSIRRVERAARGRAISLEL